MLKIAVVVGSTRRESINRKFAEALVKLGAGRFEPVWVRIDDLPLFNQDDEKNAIPAVARFKGEIQASDGVLFVTPEHNRSVPAALKNAVDWATRPGGANVLLTKPVAVAGTSPGAISSAVAQQHLKGMMHAISAGVLGFPEAYLRFEKDLIGADGVIANEGTGKFLQLFVDRMIAFVGALAQPGR
jgi:chromate reductase